MSKVLLKVMLSGTYKDKGKALEISPFFVFYEDFPVFGVVVSKDVN